MLLISNYGSEFFYGKKNQHINRLYVTFLHEMYIMKQALNLTFDCEKKLQDVIIVHILVYRYVLTIYTLFILIKYRNEWYLLYKDSCKYIHLIGLNMDSYGIA